MTTQEIAKRTKTMYFIEFVHEDLANSYFQLVRTGDLRILAAYKDIEYVWAFCFHAGIVKEDVSLW